MELGQFVENYAFRDIVQLWARERLVHEVLVAQELAVGVLEEGLRFQSHNPKFVKSSEELRREPFVGFSLRSNVPVIIRSDALEHLKAVAGGKVDFSPQALRYEYVMRFDFKNWLIHTGRSMPAFWYGLSEHARR